MKLYNLIAQTPIAKILPHINCDPDDWYDYIKVYNTLLNKTPKENDTILQITRYSETDSYDVFGVVNNEKYAMELQPWDYWLGLTIDEESLSALGPEKFLAETLYEMTFVSFDEQEILNEKEHLIKLAEEVEKGRVQ